MKKNCEKCGKEIGKYEDRATRCTFITNIGYQSSGDKDTLCKDCWNEIIEEIKNE